MDQTAFVGSHKTSPNMYRYIHPTVFEWQLECLVDVASFNSGSVSHYPYRFFIIAEHLIGAGGANHASCLVFFDNHMSDRYFGGCSVMGVLSSTAKCSHALQQQVEFQMNSHAPFCIDVTLPDVLYFRHRVVNMCSHELSYSSWNIPKGKTERLDGVKCFRE